MAAPSIPWAVQTALVARLRAHFVAEGITWPVLDHAPQNEPFPFVQIGMVPSQDVSGIDWRATQVVVSIFGYSGYSGQKQAHEINAEIRAALDEREDDLVLDVGACVQCRVSSQSVEIDPDGVTYVASSIVTLTIEH